MNLTNYSDTSKRGTSEAGFQFVFRCECCSRTWSTAFKPYRRAGFAGTFARVSRLIGGFGAMVPLARRFADFGEQQAWQSALDGALESAQERYVECPECGKAACEKCWDPDQHRCTICDGGSARSGPAGRATVAAETITSGATGLRCPNCSTVIGGSRFCAECGFDMASTHKSCPSCGVLCTRTARFCTDCGHGF